MYVTLIGFVLAGPLIPESNTWSLALCSVYSLKFSICFTANKMQKAETVLISIVKRIDQIPLQSYCCGHGGVLFGFEGQIFQSAKSVESSWVFRWAQQASGASQMSECFKRALSPAAPREENGLFLCVKKPAGKCCCFILGYKTEDDSSVYSLDQNSCYASHACQHCNIYFSLSDPTWTW